MDNNGHQVWQIRFQVEKIPCDQGDQGKSHVLSVISVIISAFTGRQPSQIKENWLGWEGFLGEVLLSFHISLN